MKEDYILKPYTIKTTGADMTLELLASKIDSGDIEIPKFQRGHVWSITAASKLIESFLLGLPVPQIFLYQDPATQKLLVVDGQQRLMAIHAFFKGIYKGREFRLHGIASQWNEKTYDELSEPDKRRLKNIPLRSSIFEQVDPTDNTSIFEVFERLNTGGMQLTAQEVRNAVVGGDLNDLTKELNRIDAWRNLTSKATTEERYRDIEIVLRLVALEDTYKHYKRPMKLYLTEYLSDHKKLSEEKKSKILSDFTNTISIIDSEIGPRAFRITTAINVALADALYVGICKNLNSLPSDIKYRYDKLLKDKSFLEAVQQHTTDTDKVNARITMCIQAFKK